MKLCKELRIKVINHPVGVILSVEDCNQFYHNPKGPARIETCNDRIVSIHYSIKKPAIYYNQNYTAIYKVNYNAVVKTYNEDYSIFSIGLYKGICPPIAHNYPKGKVFDNLRKYLKEAVELLKSQGIGALF